MFHLTREIRFAINPQPGVESQLGSSPSNSYGGFPSLTGIGHYLVAQVTLTGNLNSDSQYLINIKEIDAAVRDQIGGIRCDILTRRGSAIGILRTLHSRLLELWPERFESISLGLSPTLAVASFRREPSMIRLSQKFEFAASHRLHNPKLSDEQNRRIFGKCNNPHGHGHNYEVQVTLAGMPDANGVLVDIPAFERTVVEAAIDRLDHKNLNVEVAEFRELIPTVENIARMIYQLLKSKFDGKPARLASVTVWETPKTWCEYAE